jgi:lipopolysaccharide export system protein LptC
MAAAMERRYWVLLVVLVLLAAGTQWLRWLWRERPDAETFAGPPRSDYTLTRFTMDALDTSGKRTFRISGPFLARRGEDGSIFVTTPEYALVDGSGKAWTGHSDSAWVDREGSVMKLLGEVALHRPASAGSPAVDVLTTDLTTHPREKTFATDAAATIRQPGSILEGTGMRGDLDAKTLELLSDVHSVLQPARARRTAD